MTSHLDMDKVMVFVKCVEINLKQHIAAKKRLPPVRIWTNRPFSDKLRNVWSLITY